jgi:excisionase family DNA binding protein
MTNPEQHLLSIHEAATALGVSRRTLERLIADAELPSIQVSSRRRLIDPRDLEAFIGARRNTAQKIFPPKTRNPQHATTKHSPSDTTC